MIAVYPSPCAPKLFKAAQLSGGGRSGGAGTDCWMPPEGLQGRCVDTASLTFSYDVHPAGSLLYYVLCAGAHSRGRCCHHAASRLFAFLKPVNMEPCG